MAHLFNRRVLLAVCGGIAAYKSAELVRGLQDRGAEVRVLMTRGAQEFITPLTLQALSGHPCTGELLDEEAERGMGHIELARWADLLLIAPATADCLARLARDGRRPARCRGAGNPGTAAAGAGDEPADVARSGDAAQSRRAARARLHMRRPGQRRTGLR
jgi:hypothetical protein